MSYMFYYVYAFDQDLSQWCVLKITRKPDYFDQGSAFENQSGKQPQWGECPATVLAPIHYLLLN
jgi:hypothetical protein